MKIVAYLAAKGKTRITELNTPSPLTIHEQRGNGPLTHIGFAISGFIKEDTNKKPTKKPSKPKRLDIVFSTAEAKQFYEALGYMLGRFDKTSIDGIAVPSTTSDSHENEEDEDDEDAE